MKRFLIAFVVLAALTASARGDVDQQVDAYLGSIDTPITDAQWRALGPEADAVLARTIESEVAMPTRRARALDGLRVVNPVHASKLATRLIADEHAPFVLRRSALWTAAKTLPADRAVAALQPVLQASTSAALRASAAQALAETAPKAGCSAVKAQVARESSENKVRFERAEKACTAAKSR
jgi:hypothetical protein